MGLKYAKERKSELRKRSVLFLKTTGSGTNVK